MARKSPKREPGSVYSSEHGRMCPHCGLPVNRCVCRANPRGGGAEAPPGDGVVRVRLEKKGRGGKTVTTASGIALGPHELRDLGGALRRRCGAGGTAKDGVVEIQGDHVETLITALREEGFRVKRAGG